METQILSWLAAVSSTVVRIAVALFVVLNAVAAVTVVATRSRALVNRWASPWLAANLILLGAGVGTPIAVGLVKVAVRAVAAASRGFQTAPTPAPARPAETRP